MNSVPSLQRRIDSVVHDYVAKLPSSASTYDKVRRAYEFVINNTSYDTRAPHNQSMASVFLNRRSVCAGYSRAFCHLLRSVGVPCGCVLGNTKRDDATRTHLWNIVCIDGVYTYVDTTWGELKFLGRKSEGLSYEYLCVTTKELLRTRTISAGQSLPQCTLRRYDWFARQGLLLSGFSATKFDSLLAEAHAASSNIFLAKFSTQTAYDQCLHE